MVILVLNRDYSNPKIICFKIYRRISVTFYENSNKVAYYSFTTPESANYILEYLRYRKRCGEELNDKFPLIRDHFIMDDLLHIEKSKNISVDIICYVFKKHTHKNRIKNNNTNNKLGYSIKKIKKRGVSKSWLPRVHAYSYDKC